MHRITLIIVCLLYNNLVCGQEKTTIKITKIGPRYHLSIEALLAAKITTIYGLLTDYNQISELDPAITSSRTISDNGSIIRVETLSYDCIGPFCLHIKHTQDVQSFNQTVIVAKTISFHSDYRYGYMQWHLQPVISKHALPQTLLSLMIELEPDFWLPPIVGDYFFEQKFSSSLVVFFKRLEKQAKQIEKMK